MCLRAYADCPGRASHHPSRASCPHASNKSASKRVTTSCIVKSRPIRACHPRRQGSTLPRFPRTLRAATDSSTKPQSRH
ncbi:uncharacterized protein BKA78DRAFT_311838 [Phyllosticta capitalensis]|uniref:uncharacterized protein n=1 Tax=Phyllosticta capitalensis TaxID=121624 RepID=UPI00312F77AC